MPYTLNKKVLLSSIFALFLLAACGLPSVDITYTLNYPGNLTTCPEEPVRACERISRSNNICIEFTVFNGEYNFSGYNIYISNNTGSELLNYMQSGASVYAKDREVGNIIWKDQLESSDPKLPSIPLRDVREYYYNCLTMCFSDDEYNQFLSDFPGVDDYLNRIIGNMSGDEQKCFSAEHIDNIQLELETFVNGDTNAYAEIIQMPGRKFNSDPEFVTATSDGVVDPFRMRYEITTLPPRACHTDPTRNDYCNNPALIEIYYLGVTGYNLVDSAESVMSNVISVDFTQ